MAPGGFLMQGTLGFAMPWLLVAGLALPLLYLLLRLLPPAPRRVRLPSFRLLGTAEIPPPPSAKPPWWLLLLRIGIAVLLIIGLAGPAWQPPVESAPPARLAIVIDNGWAAASQWDRMVAAAADRIKALDRSTRFAVIATARRPDDASTVGFVDGATASAQLAALSPLPWPGDRAAAARLLPAGAARLWIADGVEDAGAGRLRGAMRGGEVLAIAPVDPAFRIAGRTRGGWSAQLVRADASPAPDALTITDVSGARLHREPLTFDGSVATVRVALDPQARAAAARLRVGGSVQATFLADGGGERPRVVVVEGRSDAPPLESGGFYVRRALEPHADVAVLSLAAAAADPASFHVLVDVAADAVQAAPLLRKVERGAVLVLFAGPRIAENGSAFSPVVLRSGARALGGVLSWQKPQAFGGFAPETPLAGLPLRDARVSRQLLAATESGAERWAWLADGTPVVSAARRGAGLLILVHTAADPSWSELPLSGTFEAMLRRLLPLGADPRALDIAAETPWVLERMLGARGDLQDLPRQVAIAAEAFEAATASAATPPGIYRSGDLRRALNLSSALGPRFVFAPLATDGLHRARAPRLPVDLGRWLLLAAALLAAFDVAVALRMRGTLAMAAALLLVHPAEAAGDIELAYVKSGSAAVDATSAHGLEVLAGALARRTSVAPGKPVAVDPVKGDLGRYPVLYWPASNVRTVSPSAAMRLRDYLASGGLILFDFGRPLGAGSGARDLLGPLGLPALAEVGPDHVLSKTFYLLPGFIGGAVWAEAGSDGASGRVSGIVIGGGDWAALWSGDRAASPAAREAALRFGINLVMYALTGTYKADQVHTRALLERMGETRR